MLDAFEERYDQWRATPPEDDDVLYVRNAADPWECYQAACEALGTREVAATALEALSEKEMAGCMDYVADVYGLTFTEDR